VSFVIKGWRDDLKDERRSRFWKKNSEAMGVKIDTLTPEQVKYLGSWEKGI